MRRLLPLAFLGFIVLLPLAASDYALTIAVYVALAALVALGLSLLTGAAGIASFGQAAYVGLGAYLSAILTTQFGWSPWASLPVVLAVSLAGAWFGAAITVRLSDQYLPIATIAFAVSAYYLFGASQLGGGQSGMSGLKPLSLFGRAFSSLAWYALAWALFFAALRAAANLLDSREGRAIRALRNVVMAEAMGVDTRAVKLRLFVLACVSAAFVGWLYAHFQRFINPSPFSLGHGIDYLFMTVVGGAGNLWGALVGATLVTSLKSALQNILPGLIGQTGSFENVVFGALVILLFHFAPEGLTETIRRRLGWRALEPREVDAAARLAPRARIAAQGPILKVSGACKSFGGLAAVRDMALEVGEGEIVALIGPNGAGKSTFFNLVSGADHADAGRFEFLGAEITGLPARRVAERGLSRTFQHVRLLADRSAIENVALGAHLRGGAGLLRGLARLDRADEAAIFAEARRQLERVGLGGELWSEAGALPLGRQRIVEIARALAADPKLLLLDEPAAGLRRKEKQELAALLSQLRAEGLAILIVEHDMEFVMRLADRVVVMEFGGRIAEGAPSEIRANRRVIEAYLGGAP